MKQDSTPEQRKVRDQLVQARKTAFLRHWEPKRGYIVAIRAYLTELEAAVLNGDGPKIEELRGQRYTDLRDAVQHPLLDLLDYLGGESRGARERVLAGHQANLYETNRLGPNPLPLAAVNRQAMEDVGA